MPDKDADGLDAGVIIHRTLTTLGKSPSLIDVHLIKKGTTIHHEEERAAMQAKNPKHIIVVDQGSVSAPPVVDSPDVQSLIIDHHLSDEFPKNATVRSTASSQGHSLRGIGGFCLPLSACCDLSFTDIRDLQRLASRHCKLLWLSMCNGHAWRSRHYVEVETSIS